MKKIIFVIAFINVFSSYSNTVNRAVDSTIVKNNILSLNLSQLYMGELRLSVEHQSSEKKYHIYGIGIIYMTKELSLIRENYGFPPEMTSDIYYGFKLFYGNKLFINKNKYISYLTFFKYEKDENLELLDYCIIDRYPLNCGGSEWRQFVPYRNKYVLGAELLFGQQNHIKHKLISDFYFGVGLRIKLSYYPYEINKTELSYFTKGFIMPSIHIGYAIGYKFKK